MELQQIRYFLEVAATQHITRSAEKLHIAQPALSQSIHRLEKDLGVPLFVSKGRNIVLTEYGKYLRDRLIPIMTELDAIPSRLRAMAELEAQTIHLNVLAATALVTEAIIGYRETHTAVRFQMMQNARSDLYDICITTKLMYQNPELEENSRYVCGEQIYLAVPKSHPFAALSSISLVQAADEGFISLMGSRQLRWICDRYCLHAGFTPRIVFESDSPAAVQNMIAANMGVGFWPEFTWGTVDREKVTLLPIKDPHCHRELLIERKTNPVSSPAADDFYTWLCRYVEQARTRHT